MQTSWPLLPSAHPSITLQVKQTCTPVVSTVWSGSVESVSMVGEMAQWLVLGALIELAEDLRWVLTKMAAHNCL